MPAIYLLFIAENQGRQNYNSQSAVIRHPEKTDISKTVGETKNKLEKFLRQLKNNFKYSTQISDDVLKGV